MHRYQRRHFGKQIIDNQTPIPTLRQFNLPEDSSETEYMTTGQKSAFIALAEALKSCEGEFTKRELQLMLAKYTKSLKQGCLPHLEFADGTTLSVQSSFQHYGHSDNTHFECAASVETMDTSQSKEVDVLSAHEVLKYAEAHGGIVKGCLPPLDFGRPTFKKRTREVDADVLERRSRLLQEPTDHFKTFKGVLTDATFEPSGDGGEIKRLKGQGDGLSVLTTPILKTIREKDVTFVETNNSVYAIFEPEHDASLADESAQEKIGTV